MKRGEIYFIKSTYREEGSEQRADRPAVIVSNDANNENSDVVEVVYMTTRPKTDLPTHVLTRNALSPSTILCEQVHSVSTGRVGTLIGRLSEQELAAVDTALAISLDLAFKAEPKKSLQGSDVIARVFGVSDLLVQQLAKEGVIPAAQIQPYKFDLLPTVQAYIKHLSDKANSKEQKSGDAEFIKLETERDLYRKLYSELLENITKGART